MKKLRYLIETLVVLFLSWISGFLSRRSRKKFGKILSKLLYFALPERVRIAEENLRSAFPDNDEAWIKTTAKKVFENMGIVFAEFLALSKLSDEEIKDYVRFENVQLIKEKYNQGRGVLLLSGHYGNWELLAYSVSVYLGLPVLVIVKPLANYFLDKIINKFRTSRGNSVVSMYMSAFKVVKTLKDGGIVALLADQSATKDKDIFVEFFGRKAATFDSPAHFALKYDVPIILGFARREDYYYKVRLVEIDHSDLNFSPEGKIRLTERYVQLLEDAIRQQPELWLWTHRRWKHNPTN
ncbi:MAG: lysophospholipid acyltransferase family protein [Candidatus Kapaibacteriota bacterium]